MQSFQWSRASTRSLCLIGLTILATACNNKETLPPDPALANINPNTVTKRQKIVEAFKTAEVTSVPYHQADFLVRDTNGAIWYVNTDTSSSSPECGTTMIFAGPGQNNWTVAPPVRVDPDLVDLSNRVALATVLFDSMVQSIAKAQAKATNVLIEDPIKK